MNNMLSVNLTNTFSGVPLSVDFNSPVDYLLFIFQILFATSAVLLAGTVVIGIAATESLRMENRFIFMLNTSVSDTLTGLSVYYLGLFDVDEGYPSRNATFYILPSFLGVNIMTFLFAQFDRYLAICYPYIYCRFITRQFVICVNVYCWFHVYFLLLVRSFLPLAKAVEMHAFSIVSLQVIVITKVAMTIKLYIIARYQIERDPPTTEKENKKESLRIIIFVVASFLILWSPSFVNIVLRLVIRQGVVFENEAKNVFAIMARLNALCTPSVYIRGSPALREAMMKTVWGKVCMLRPR
ncbi:uncharacterized protein FYW47_007811 [Aplochiton taeniatus]